MKLKKDHIREAFLGIKFSENVLPIEIIEDVCKKHFATIEVKQTFVVNIVDKANSVPEVQKEYHGISLSLPGEKELIVERDRILLVKKKPYYEKGGDAFIEEFMFILNTFGVSDFSKAVDFGLRFTNEFTVSDERFLEEDFESLHWFSLCKISSVINDRRQIVFKDKDGVNDIVNLVISQQQGAKDITVDIDTHANIAGFALTRVSEVYKRLRESKNNSFKKIFRNCEKMVEFINV